MGKKTVERASNSKYGKTSAQPHNTLERREKGANFYHSGAKLKRLKVINIISLFFFFPSLI